MESDSTTTHKISDSGYSHSTSNSNSHSSASSKSRNSGSNSSRSSGYCGGNTQVDINGAPQPPKRKKEKLHKQKKAKLDEEKLKTTSECKEDTSLTLNEKVAQEVLGNNETPLVENDVLNDANATDDVAETAASPLIAAVQPATEKFWEDALQQSPTANNEDDTHKHPMQSNEGGFCCVISMYNGVILYTTPSLTDVLGFPKDMWLGRSFIDFVHPKDRETFSSQITKGIAIPMVDASGKIKSVKNSLYVCLRRYRGLKTSRFGVVDKAVPYQAFKLTVTLCHMSDMMGSKYIYSKGGTFLVVVAVPVYSSYKVPDEKTVSPKFCMRHTVSCVFSHVDPDVVTNFGFLPQDMLGKSIFDFYHPEDMPFMKEVYQSIIKMCPIAGAVFRSKPYRFAVQNGGFAIIETEWTSFVNPWSRRLEFVIGLHKVVQGPLNPNVFETPKDELRNVPEEVLNESKTVQEEILVLLNKVVPSNPINELSAPNDVAKQEISKCAMDLAVFMESLVEKVCNSGSQVDMSSQPVPTFSERDSAMLGDISPHHDYYDSKSSSETPPSYNQLNYNETLQRFFQSKPKTSFSDESNERTDTENYNNRDGNNSKEKCSLPIDNSGTSGSGSNGNLSSGSNCNLDSGMSSGNHDAYKSQLTEALLTRHNHDMEKIMYKKHKKQRHVTKDLDADRMVDRGDQDPNHGVKRYGSQSWEGENHKQSKPNHHQYSNNSSQHTNNTNRNQRSCDNQRTNEPNIWPPFSMSDTTFRNSNQNCSINRPPTNVASVPGLVPICCYHPPHVAPCNACLHSHHHPLQVSVPLCTGVHPVLPAVICTVPAVHNRPESYAINNHGCMGSRTLLVDVASNRATSHATSVNVEPGSGRGSTASVCGVNKAMTEGSRKDVEFQSVCSPGSPLVSPQDGESVVDAYNLTKQTIEIVENQSNDHKQKRQDDDSHNSSSCSSFYSQFLKTDTGSGSNDDSNSKKQSDGNDYPVQKIVPMRNKLPPWQENVEMRPDLVYRYQLVLENVENILRADLQTLKEMNQPSQVNKQLEQLYVEMELGGLGNKLKLDEATTSSSSSSDDSGADSDKISTQLPVEVTCRDICTKFSTILDWKEEKVVQFPSDDLRGERTVTTTRK